MHWCFLVLRIFSIITADSISLPLCILFTKSLNAWKKGCVTPIYKKAPCHLIQNYRPITLTSIIGQILDSIALLTYFNCHSLLSESQHGFVPKRSCTSQLLTALEELYRAIQGNTYSDAIYLSLCLQLLKLCCNIFIFPPFSAGS